MTKKIDKPIKDLEKLNTENAIINSITNAVNIIITFQQEKEKRIFNERKEELNIIMQLDKREKTYKIILITLCIIALLISFNIGKSEIIVPVLTLIIGASLKVNSLSEFFSWKNKKKTNEQIET